MLVPEIFAARCRSSCMAADRPNKTSSGGSRSADSIPFFLLGFSDGIGTRWFQQRGGVAHGSPLSPESEKVQGMRRDFVTYLNIMTYDVSSRGSSSTDVRIARVEHKAEG